MHKWREAAVKQGGNIGKHKETKRNIREAKGNARKREGNSKEAKEDIWKQTETKEGS